MAIHLVDTENTAHWWGTCQNIMRKGDKIILFYTDNSHDLHFPLFDNISDLDIPIQFMKCMCGPTNALDFQLVSYLGYLISQDPGQTYYIIANDAGYDAAVAFWQRRGVDVLRVMFIRPGCLETMSGQLGVTAVRSDILQQFKDVKSIRLEFERLLPENYISELDSISDIFQDVIQRSRKARRAITFRNRLTKQYGLSAGSEIYRILKPYAADLLRSIPDLSAVDSALDGPGVDTSSEKAGSLESEEAGDVFEGEESSRYAARFASVISRPVSEASKKYDYTWDSFLTFVNSHSVCLSYRRSLVHDFKFMGDTMSKQVMAVMAYAMMWTESKHRIDKVMKALAPTLPKNIGQQDLKSLRGRLSKKMSSGVWPDFIDKKLTVQDAPPALSVN